MHTLEEIIAEIEQFAPLSLQESWDNSGLQIGHTAPVVSGVLITLDLTEEILEEALALRCNLILSHHPLIFRPVRKLGFSNATERIIRKAIQHDIAIYSAHTNLDAVWGGVNTGLAKKLELQNISILEPKLQYLYKISVNLPVNYLSSIQNAMFQAGAGLMGNYNQCGFSTEGTGTFQPLVGASPFLGKTGQLHTEQEIRFETLVPRHHLHRVIQALLESHPYEKPAYDIIPLYNEYEEAGTGAVGELSEPVPGIEFLQRVQRSFPNATIRYSSPEELLVSRVAVCGGSGSGYREKAIASGAQAYVSADFKYHDFEEAKKRILLVDIGHYESELHTKEIFHKLLTKKKHNFAVHISKTNTNSINHLI